MHTAECPETGKKFLLLEADWVDEIHIECPCGCGKTYWALKMKILPVEKK